MLRSSIHGGQLWKQMRRISTAALLSALALAPRAARAEPLPSLDLRGFELTTHPEGLTYLEPTATPDAGDWNVGARFSYAYRAIVAPDAAGGVVPVKHQLAADLAGSVGLGERIGLGLALPAALYQIGEDRTVGGASAPPGTALGDLAAVARATLLPQGALGGLGLAALGRVTIPTGHRRSYLGEGQLRGEARVLGELGVLGSALRGSLGLRLRGEERRFAEETFGHDLPFGLGLVLRPQVLGLDRQGNWLWSLDVHGAVSVTPRLFAREQTPVALALGVRRSFGELAAVAGVEAGLTRALGVPAARALLGVTYAPRSPDADGDGIEDERDDCMELAEDRDGFEDGDGCPDFDNDGDGVPDENDRCPRELEDLDENADDDGCPDLDDDRDGILDDADACPREPGPPDKNAQRHGCPARDRDMDGIPDPRDKCVTRAEDRDGFEDEDGCPDLDDDRDGVPDRNDACVRVAGQARSDPALNGCPSPDRDGDTFDDAVDRCPEHAETFDGTTDEDGCPDRPATGRAPALLAELLPAKAPEQGRFVLKLARPVEFEAGTGASRPTAGSEPVLRAIATLLNARPEMVLMVAVRPLGPSAEQEQLALTRSFVLVDALRALTHRDEAAETIGWRAVERVRGATQPSGLGFLVLAPLVEPADPKPDDKAKGRPADPKAVP